MPVIHHDLDSADAATMAAMRAQLSAAPRPRITPEGRPAYDELMANVPAVEGITVEPAEIGGIGGWWCRPADADPHAAILYLHGGGYVVGSPWAYRPFVGQIAARAGAAAFVADYGLGPERRFPGAFDDAVAAYEGLLGLGINRVALCGDSAGGGLTLAVLLALSRWRPAPVGAVAMSPGIDLALTATSMETRAAADPLLSRETLTEAARQYLNGADPNDARVNALSGDIEQMPPVLIHVGDDEVLLDDTLRFVARADAAGRQCVANVWAGMTHVFPSNPALDAAKSALDDIGSFLRARLRLGSST